MKYLCLGVLLAAPPCFADTVQCHIVYGGENFDVSATPTSEPYRVETRKIGRYFEFKLVYVTTPAERAAIRVYVYGVSQGESVLIHEVLFPASVANQPLHGFTGFQSIYEPTRSSEFQYWCEKR
jgi:hypothetical protein